MRILNLFLITLLCLAIPLQGVARVMTVETACPAKLDGMTTDDSVHNKNCCNDIDTVAKTGQHCKAEQDCQPTSLGMINQLESPLIASVGAEKISPPNAFALTFDPSATWRPPTQA
jgi:hypothetical protein